MHNNLQKELLSDSYLYVGGRRNPGESPPRDDDGVPRDGGDCCLLMMSLFWSLRGTVVGEPCSASLRPRDAGLLSVSRAAAAAAGSTAE